MRKLAAITAVVLALSTPVAAQQGNVGMTSAFLLGSTYGAQTLNLYGALQSRSQVSAGQFAFAPDPVLRKSVTRNVLADIARKDPGLAGALGSNPFGTFGPALSAHNIRDTQMDDALAFMMLSLWDAANASSAETTPGQAEGVKRQARALLASMGGRPAVGSPQEASDQMYLSALMVSILASKVLETRDPSAVRQLQDMARRESMASFGVDFTRLALTEQGFMPR